MKLRTEEIAYINTFETLTGAPVKDCVVDEERIIFVVKEGYMGKAIGKNGANIKKLEKMLNKKIHLVEYGDSPERMIRKIFFPVEVKEAYITEKNGKKTLYVRVDGREKKRVMGGGGFKIRIARTLLQRHFGIENVVVS